MTDQIPTPRTDDYEIPIDIGHVVPARFARQLERELTVARIPLKAIAVGGVPEGPGARALRACEELEAMRRAFEEGK